ncbi:uncharacterized protein LOC131615070 [Vicia villosa]|uniref:uncharacterized protein LOC131615070 n=1 Tax=Vicia villosa TaxID=3911 RepID=UPI00273B9ADC|nr:uncharacterized protein LOC131615070 [Vicia villosa]
MIKLIGSILNDIITVKEQQQRGHKKLKSDEEDKYGFFSYKARNKRRFDNQSTHWKTCASSIAARASLVGSLTKRKANNSIQSFSLLKAFDIAISPRSPSNCLEVLWCPPSRGWVKCNTDGVASGSPLFAACGGIFRDEEANHIISFAAYIGLGSPVVAEFMAVIIAIEKAILENWSRLWIETDCKLVVKAFANVHLVPWVLKSRWLTC